jgi:6-phosphogluconate dehydrogenase
MERLADIGIWGLGVMGRNLARNFADHGFAVSIADPWPAAQAAAAADTGDRIALAATPEAFVAGLSRPRRILLMVKAGAPVDAAISALAPLLTAGDAVIDGGNTHFRDTQRRVADLSKAGIDFLGMGVSGGEEGARHGPSLMVGGAREAYARAAPLLTAIAAKAGDDPCCAWLGKDGAGHYVKMVHNGIEYAEMQLIAEAYDLMHRVGGLDHAAMQAVFRRWSAGEAGSYLLEITAVILAKRDADTGRPLVELVLDKAEQKGTGQWAAVSALELGVPVPTLIAAVTARGVSALMTERHAAAGVLAGPVPQVQPGADLVEALGEALLAAKICVYAQGFALLAQAAAEFAWELDLARTAEIWRAGCIIRGHLLEPIAAAYRAAPKLANLMLAPALRAALARGQDAWRRVVATAVAQGVPVPAFSSALDYYDAYRSRRLPANLIQAQRDHFGAHGYQRTDRDGAFHSKWDGA